MRTCGKGARGGRAAALLRAVPLALVVAAGWPSAQGGEEGIELTGPSDLAACQVAYGAEGSVLLEWTNAEPYQAIELFLDGEAAPGAVDGALASARVLAAPGEHVFGVRGVAGERSSPTALVTFTVLAATPLGEPITALDCELLPGAGGTLRLRWELGLDPWESGLVEIAGVQGSWAVAAGATEASIPALGAAPHVAVLRFKSAGGHFSEPLTATCLARTPAFVRGDCDGVSPLNLTDPLFALNELFLRAPRWFCDDACDSNDDGRIDISDPIHTLSFLFLAEPAPPAPGPEECGVDPTADFLGGICACPSGFGGPGDDEAAAGAGARATTFR
jgi:hypothetical protein